LLSQPEGDIGHHVRGGKHTYGVISVGGQSNRQETDYRQIKAWGKAKTKGRGVREGGYKKEKTKRRHKDERGQRSVEKGKRGVK